ncbi:PQQ-binding-like beta-propeller repeat protein [Amycolatopsis cynarae]|uniref:PQQ-binding-like beta-propeller repeat protein n=1 Tax=Amycolatopsis cynarae TaxID=2995223 RepID=A0ABY7BBQ1_9PSEU|nr:PQQ-binding-like beta-propeller repeat protein [Amycolatopsis sp. HUAS 11-8]WAL69417.1 PQQ-binding-like beta-propeller repeat protein [Amycolatopsis sp. HUAS 11-8]
MPAHQHRLRGVEPVTVRAAPDAAPAAVAARPYPQTLFGETGSAGWQNLTGGPEGWSGSVDVSALAPGRQRLQVRVSAPDGTWWEQVALFTVPGTAADPVPRWEYRLPGAVQGGIALLDPERGLTVAAGTGGEVVALRADGRPRWRARTGPVYRRPAVDTARELVFVPSADHHLRALDAGTGRPVWDFDAGAPVLSAPVAAGDAVVFSAGGSLFALGAADGRVVWSVPGRGFSSGQAAWDGQRVYTTADDGYARAYDARTGAPVWTYQMATGTRHRVALYGGWDTVVALGAGPVVVATVSGTTALDAATGAVKWTRAGSTMYAPAVVVGDGTLLLTTEWGVLSRVDLATGTVVWQAGLGARVFNAGVVVDRGTVWALSVDGKLLGVRLADGVPQGRLQHSLVYTFSRPVIAGDTLVVGDQNGVVRGIRLP